LNFTFSVPFKTNGNTIVADPRGVVKNKSTTIDECSAQSIIMECGSHTYLAASVITRYTIPLNKIKVGRFCSIAQNVKFIGANNHHHEWITSFPLELITNYQNNIDIHLNQPKDISIGNDVWIGDGATIMPGTHIADGCVIGTNSLVTKSTQSYGVYGGNPAKLIKFRFNNEIISRLLEILWWKGNDEFILANASIIFSEPTLENLDKLNESIKKFFLYEESIKNLIVARIF
jgi:acetyltransferase-like isoleucine patch superfamily enzyme